MRRTVVILDGPPASGKTTLGLRLLARTHARIISYRAFGPANVIAGAILKLGRNNSNTLVHEDPRSDPFLRLPYTFWRKTILTLTLLELLYKFFQQITILLLVLLKPSTVVDEFLVLRFANYINALRQKIINFDTFKLFYWQDVRFFKLISSLAQVKYIILEPDLSILLENWKKRGHIIPYDLRFLAMTKCSSRIVKEDVVDVHRIKANIIKVKTWDIIEHLANIRHYRMLDQ